jgi:hypothetical protein
LQNTRPIPKKKTQVGPQTFNFRQSISARTTMGRHFPRSALEPD